MNKVFKVIWNATSQSWVAVSELGKAKTKTKSVSLAAAGVALALAGAANAATETPATGGAKYDTVTGAQNNQVVIGYNSKAESGFANSVAIGTNVQALEKGNVVIGLNSTAKSANDIAIGYNATAYSTGTDPDSNTNSGRQSAIAIGTNTLADKWNATAIGTFASANAEGASAYGNGANASGVAATALGEGTDATGQGSTAAGRDAQATAQAASAMGSNSQATATQSTAVGSGSQATQLDASAFGWGSAATGVSSTALGDQAKASEQNSLASGFAANASGFAATATGANSQAAGYMSVATGNGAKANSGGSIATGANANATGGSSIAIGDNAAANGNQAMAVGARASATGQRANAIGASNNVTGAGSTAIGYNNTVTAGNAFVLGANVVDAMANSVVLGANSDGGTNTPESANKVAGDTTVTPANGGKGYTYDDANYAGKPTAAGNFLSIGAVGNERQVKHMAAGNVSANSTDGINGSQLFAVMQRLENVAATGFKLGENNTAKDAGTAAGTNATNIGLEDQVNFNNGSLTVARVEIVKGTDTDEAKVTYDVVTQALDTTKTDGKAAVGTDPAKAGDTTLAAANPNALTTAQNVADAINASGFQVQGNGADKGLVNPGDKVNFANGTATTAEVETAGDTTTVKYSVNTDGTTTQIVDGKVAAKTSPITTTGAAGNKVSATEAPTALATAGDVVTAVNSAREVVKSADKTVTVVATENATTGGTDFNLSVNTDGTTITKDSETGAIKANTTDLTPNAANGTIATPAAADAAKLVNASTVANAINNAGWVTTNTDGTKSVVKPGSEVNYVNGTGTTANVTTVDGKTTVKFDLAKATGTVNADGTVSADPATGDSFLTAADVVNLVNNAAFTVKASGNTEGTVESSKVVAGNEIIYAAGKNLVVEQAGKTFTYRTANEVEFDKVTVGPVVIDSTKGIDAGDTVITNVKAGTNATDAANVGQLPKLANGTNTVVNATTGANGETIYTVETKGDVNNITSITIGKDGKDGKDGEPAANISVAQGPAGVNGKDGETITRIVYTDPNNPNAQPEQVATLNDGLKFVGDDGKEIAKKLNETLTVKGGADAANLTDNNIGVVAGEDGSLTVKLAKDVDLGKDGSVTAGTVNVGGGKDANGNDLPTTALTTVNAPAADVNGKPTGETVPALSVGGNKITDVANGLINADSKDAVNGAQLYAVASNVTNVVETLNKGLTFAGNQNVENNNQDVTKQLGETVTVKGGLANDAAASDKNTRVDIVNGELVVKISENPEFTTVTATDKIAIVNGPSISKDGIDAANTKVTNVTAGTADTDAVNVSQLKEWFNKAESKTVITTKADGSSTNASANGANGKDGQDGTTTSTGEGLTLVAGDNVVLNQAGTTVNIAVSKNPEFDTAKIGGQGANGANGVDGKVTVADKAGNTGVTITAADGVGVIGLNGKDGASASISVEKGADNAATGEKGANGVDGTNGAGGTGKDRITYTTSAGVKEQVATMNDGLVFGGDTGTDSAVKLNNKVTVKGAKTTGSNGAQVQNISVNSDGNGNLEVKLAEKVDLGTNGEIKAGGVTINNSGINAGGKTITGVKEGTTADSAVNKGQLDRVAGALNDRVHKLDKRVRGIGASSAASSSLPQVYIPGKSMVAAAAGGYSGASAIAVGYSRASDSGRAILKLQGTVNSQGHVSGGVGVGFQW